MKHVRDRAQDPERPQNLEELRSRLNRRLSDFRDGWKRCEHQLCRRRKQCCGNGPDFKCTNDGAPRPAASEEEQAKVISDLYKAVKARCAEYAGGAAPPHAETPHEPRAVTRRRRKPARPAAAKTAADSPQADRPEPSAPIAEQTQLAPEQQARIDGAWNDYVA